MTHDELLAKIDILERDSESDIWLIHNDRCCGNCICDKAEAEATSPHKALRAVVELCKEYENDIDVSGFAEGIIQTIEKELN